MKPTDKRFWIMDNKPNIPPPYIPKHYAVFRCKVDNRMYKWPIIMLCIFDVIVFFMAPSILMGLISLLWVSPPFLIIVLLARCLWRKTTYTIDDKVLRISTPLRSLVISIISIKKIRRGKFWVERGRNYSSSYIKLRIIYDRNGYIYVSPEDEKAFIDTLQAINPNIEYSSERGL